MLRNFYEHLFFYFNTFHLFGKWFVKKIENETKKWLDDCFSQEFFNKIVVILETLMYNIVCSAETFFW